MYNLSPVRPATSVYPSFYLKHDPIFETAELNSTTDLSYK